MDSSSITLDKDTFKALASENRIAILKSLDARRKTASELSHELGTTVQGISEHLHSLQQAGLVERQESERKWVYYKLTEKGSAVLHPDSKKFWVLIALSLLAFSAYFFTPMTEGSGGIISSDSSQAVAQNQRNAMIAQATPAPANAAAAEQISSSGNSNGVESSKSVTQTHAASFVIAALLLAGAGWLKLVKKSA